MPADRPQEPTSMTMAKQRRPGWNRELGLTECLSSSTAGLAIESTTLRRLFSTLDRPGGRSETYLPQQRLYFLPEPHPHGSFLPCFPRALPSGRASSEE